MIRITANVVLSKKEELQRPENLRIVVLVVATVVLAFVVSPIVGAVIIGLMLWQCSRFSMTVDSARRAAEVGVQIGSPAVEQPTTAESP